MMMNANRAPAAAVAHVMSLAVVALVASTTSAAAQTAAELTKPTSTVEAGVGDVTKGSFKAGEYNGLQNKGAFFLGNFDIRGGGAYDSDNAMRFRLRGTDLGLDTRSVTAEAGVQGRFRVGFGYDQLRRNRSDSYETPYLGAGTNVLTLPSSWLLPMVAGSSASNNAVTTTSARGLSQAIAEAPYIDTKTVSPTIGTLLSPNAAQRAIIDAAVGADLPLFGEFDIDTTRKRFDVLASANLGEHWGVDANFRPETKDGTKLMGTVSRSTGGDISAIIPDPIDTRTDQAGASVSYRSTRSFVQAGFYGSWFTNNVPSITWQNWASASGVKNTMSSAPDNAFGQFNATGAFNASSNTKVVANASYGRNTQNQAFLTDASTPVVPVGSLDGLVVTELLNVRLTARPAKKLNVAAAYKFDNRDNQTPVNIFQFADASEAASPNPSFPASSANTLGPVLASNANANRPYSKKVNQVNAEADFALAKGQHARAEYQFQRIDRSCPGSWISCADAAITNEHTLRAGWRIALPARLGARVSYEYAARRAPDYNEDAFLALVPYAGVAPAGQTMSALDALNQYGLTGYGPVLGYNGGVFVANTFFPNNNALANSLYANGNRISELIGMRRYYVADRNRNKVRTLVTWDATEALGLQAGVDYRADEYQASTYGLQHSKAWTADLDASYAFGTHASAEVYYTYEKLSAATAGNSYTANSNTSSVNGATALSGNAGCDPFTTLQQRNNNNKIDPCLNWLSDTTDSVSTVGVGVRGHSGKLELAANLDVSRAHSDNDVSGGNWANNPLALPGAPAGTIAAYFIPAAPLPTVTSNIAELRLNGWYTVAKRQVVRVFYSYLHMSSADWVYEGMQIGIGTPSGVLPTLEQPFNYSVNVFGASYSVRF